MGSVHVAVDPGRQRVPCSGTMIRRDPFAHWEFLEPPVRAWFAKRVCVVGAESTGTTTLAQALAEHFRTAWVPEYGREYSAAKGERNESTWTTKEFVQIAREQNRREELAAKEANRLVICDTNSWATCFWHRRYLGIDSPAVRAEAEQARCDLYLLTGDEIPFVQDGLRDGEHIRREMHRWFEEGLQRQPVAWQLVRGSAAERLAQAVDCVSRLFAGSTWLDTRAQGEAL
jgi:NadR type nicotinamide-nucleotide adenylyltransferase